MEINNKKFISQVNKSKLLYAFSLVDNLVNSVDSKKIKKDLDLVWKISGFKSKKKFEDLFNSHKGISLYNYCKKLNPNCDC